MNKKRRVHILAVILASAVAFAHIQTVDASTINKAKNAKKKAEEDLNAANKKIDDLERQQAALQSEIDAKDAELVNLLVNIGILEEELADKIGVHRTYMSFIERGIRNPSLLMTFKISRALKLKLPELFEFDK